MLRVLLITVVLAVTWSCDREAEPGAEPAGATAEEVCAHLEALRAQESPADPADASCAERMPVARELDGPALWTLRSGCILGAATLEQALRCNRANHPEWPEPAGGGR